MISNGSFVRLAIFLRLLLFLTDYRISTASSTSSSSSTIREEIYQSIRSLDSSGVAVQLRHARAAADEQGRLLIGVVLGEDVYILSPTMSNRSHRRVVTVSPPLAHPITPPSGGTYVACSGIQADARWLIRQLREYSKAVWLRYNTHTTSSDVAEVCGAIQRIVFWDYPETPQWQSLAGMLDLAKWGRPLGVRTIVISWSNDPSGRNVGHLRVVEPSGIIEECHPKVPLVCIGKHSSVIHARLHEALLVEQREEGDEVGPDHLRKILCAILPAVAPSLTQVQVEVLSATGNIGSVRKETWDIIRPIGGKDNESNNFSLSLSISIMVDSLKNALFEQV